MKATDILNLLGGLALFLYGMQMMSNGLEAAAGKKMQKILERLTANRFIIQRRFDLRLPEPGRMGGLLFAG